jgi:L-alanine-DL-glutamate epimerase-like enolase superfamily enzyme
VETTGDLGNDTHRSTTEPDGGRLMAVIDRVEVRAVGPPVQRYTWAWDMPEQYMTGTIVRVRDEDGVEGIGACCSFSAGRFDLSVLETLRPLAERVLGLDSLAREAIWHDLHDLNLPLAPGAVSALDISLWDLAARRAGMPLWRLLGAARDRMLAYASTPQLRDAAAYVEFVHQLRQMGFRAVKFHAWGDPERDLAMIRAVMREHGNSGLLFMHDAEQRYERASALRVALELEALGFRWFEAPLLDHDLEGYRELRKRTRVPILPAGNWLFEVHSVAEALKDPPWDAVRFDVTVAEGITPGLKLVALAGAFGKSVELQSWGYTLNQAANLHLALGTQRTSLFEQPVPYEPFEYGVLNPIRPASDGYVKAPARPGLGIEVDWEKMQAATLASFTVSQADRRPGGE